MVLGIDKLLPIPEKVNVKKKGIGVFVGR